MLPSSGRIRRQSITCVVPNHGLQHEWGLNAAHGGHRGLQPPCTATVPCQLHALPCPAHRSPVSTPRPCHICRMAHLTWSSWS